jgi:hypothetical protein
MEYISDMLRRQNGLRRATGAKNPVPHEPDLIGVGHGEVEIVEDGEDGEPVAGAAAEGFEEGLLMRPVEAGGGFIEEKRAFLFGRAVQLGKRAGIVDALFFSSGEGGIEAVGHGIDFGFAQDRFEAALRVADAAAAGVRKRSEVDDLMDAEGEVEAGMLRDDRPSPRQSPAVPFRQRAPVKTDLALVRCPLPAEEAEEGRFSRAVGTKEDGQGSPTDLAAHLVE